MHEKLEALMPLLEKGEYDKAAEALIAYRKDFPHDWDGRLMEGIIAKLHGEENLFKLIFANAQKIVRTAIQIQSSPMWEEYVALFYKSLDEDSTVVDPEPTCLDDDMTVFEEETAPDNKKKTVASTPHKNSDWEETIIENTHHVQTLYAGPEYLEKKKACQADDSDDDSDPIHDPDFDKAPSEYTSYENDDMPSGGGPEEDPSYWHKIQEESRHAKQLQKSSSNHKKDRLKNFFSHLFGKKR